jgi:hypothetical protein
MQQAAAEQIGIAGMKAAQRGVGPKLFAEDKGGKGRKRKSAGEGGSKQKKPKYPKSSV